MNLIEMGLRAVITQQGGQIKQLKNELTNERVDIELVVDDFHRYAGHTWDCALILHGYDRNIKICDCGFEQAQEWWERRAGDEV